MLCGSLRQLSQALFFSPVRPENGGILKMTCELADNSKRVVLEVVGSPRQNA